MTPAARARTRFDWLPEADGWQVCDYTAADSHAVRGAWTQEFPLVVIRGHADYLLRIEEKPAEMFEARMRGDAGTTAVRMLTRNFFL